MFQSGLDHTSEQKAEIEHAMEMSQRMQPARTRGNWCGPPHAWRFFGTVGKAAGRAEPRYAALAFQNVLP